MILWLEVTNDKYELPVAVADTSDELGRMVGVTGNTIRKMVYKHRKGLVDHTRYILLRIDDNDEDI